MWKLYIKQSLKDSLVAEIGKQTWQMDIPMFSFALLIPQLGAGEVATYEYQREGLPSSPESLNFL